MSNRQRRTYKTRGGGFSLVGASVMWPRSSVFQGKNFFILLALVLSLASAQAEPLADSVSTLQLPGRGEYGQCTEFAEALSAWLGAHGQSSQIVYYAYKAGLARRSAAHAIVTWQRDGQLWAMGNEAGAPRRLSGAANQQSMEVAQRYDARAFAASPRGGPSPVILPAAIVAGVDSPAPVIVAPIKRRAAGHRGSEHIATSLSVASPPRFYTDANGTQFLVPQ